MIPTLFWIAPVAGVIALGFAGLFYYQLGFEGEGNAEMKDNASHVSLGARTYLRQQYKVVSIVFLVMAALFAILAFGLGLQNVWTPPTFLSGGVLSALAGFFGMRTATKAANRVTYATSLSLSRGLRVAFRSGAVMGLSVVGLGLVAISLWYALFFFVYPPDSDGNLLFSATTLLSFSMGASLQALFARVGGGIYTKAADVGADLVGKVESGIPEDDPRNPATIADNVGDFVGDVAGMGADLYESYCGSILAAAALGAAAYAGSPDIQAKAIAAPLLVAGIGALLSIGGIYLVKGKEQGGQKDLLKVVDRGINASAASIAILSLGALLWLGLPNAFGIWGALLSGLAVGIVIGEATEYYTSTKFKPTRHLAAVAQQGPATVIISGLGTGMISTYAAVIAVCVGILSAYGCGSGFDFSNIALGLYGIGFAAVGMLSTLGITLASDAYGPIADNAGGNAEMSHLPEGVRQRTDALDSLGNTTAAIGKGFAIGSAALTALALLASYAFASPTAQHFEDANAMLRAYVAEHELHILNPRMLVGLFTGSLMAFLFCGMTMNAVGRTAQKMVEEVRRQFKEDPNILKGVSKPNYARCIEISTIGAQHEMIAPALLAISAPVIIGLLLGPAGVLGLLGGGLICGFALAVFMANSGGAWDNAKKYIEAGEFGGKGSEAHKSSIIGDTIGDPFKDTAGPSLNILIKLMTMVAIVTAGITLSHSLF